jgi:hypothetical protein
MNNRGYTINGVEVKLFIGLNYRFDKLLEEGM